MADRAAPVHPGRLIQCFDHFVIDLRTAGRASTYFTVYAVEYSPELGTGHVAFLRLRGDEPDSDVDMAFTDAPKMARRMQARLRRMLATLDMSRGSGSATELEQEPIEARFTRLPWTEEGVGWRIEPASTDSPTIQAAWRAGEAPVWVSAMEGTFTEGRDILGVMAGFDAATLRVGERIAPGSPYHDPWWEPRIGRPFSSCHVALAEASLTPAGSAWWGGLR